jgi:hypothetical protein
VFWTILKVVIVVVCVLLLFVAPVFAGRKTFGQVSETRYRLWSGLWNRDDADRLR